MKNMGMPDPHGRGKGSLLIQTVIDVPKKLNKKQEDLLRQLAELDNDHVTPERKGFMDLLKSYFQSSEDAAVSATADKK